jgi:DNA-binding winged helix-turn-helix (wHTH) protein
VRVRFEPFELDVRARQLTRHDEPLHLSPKAFDLLTMLVERRPAVVDKASLRERLWPGTHVVDASLANLVVEIRDVLSDASLVRTAHGVGYAFAGEAVDVEGARPAAARRPAPLWVVWKQQALALSPGENIVGRDPACAVWIDADGVSRRHAIIRVVADEAMLRVTIEDLSSTNGTYVQDRRITGPKGLESGHRIRIGRATLIFRASKDANSPTRRVRPPKAR